MALEEDKSIYNIVTVKNIDDEDFIFSVDKIQYIVRAGEVRNFPKFMAKQMVKHLTDKILLKQDQEGSFMGNNKKRAEVSDKIVIEEQVFEKPKAPTDAEILETMNKPSDIDVALKGKPKEVVENRGMLKEDTEDSPLKEEAEKFEQLENEKQTKQLPSREEMIGYAKNTLMMDLDSKIKLNGETTTLKSAYESMTDEELFKELQMDK